ncbi:MAG TPA: hypothetical protein VMW76_09720 [Bacteroidales bacterium]|nr:hypothetical protein [Bacteroidales bacterium]
MNFYFDENLPRAIARALNELEKNRTDTIVLSTEDVWGKGIKDSPLIEKLHEAGGIMVTNDLKMKHNYYELLKKNGVSAFFIAFPSGVNFEYRYQHVFKIWEDIKKIARKEKHPFICKIPNRGKPKVEYFK